MLTNITHLLPTLAIAIVINMLLGVYNNISIDKCNFDWKVFVNGIAKAAIIACAFMGIAYAFDTTDLSAIGVTPDLIMNSAIILYMGKAVQNLIKILGITNIHVNNEDNSVG